MTYTNVSPEEANIDRIPWRHPQHTPRVTRAKVVRSKRWEGKSANHQKHIFGDGLNGGLVVFLCLLVFVCVCLCCLIAVVNYFLNPSLSLYTYTTCVELWLTPCMRYHAVTTDVTTASCST